MPSGIDGEIAHLECEVGSERAGVVRGPDQRCRLCGDCADQQGHRARAALGRAEQHPGSRKRQIPPSEQVRCRPDREASRSDHPKTVDMPGPVDRREGGHRDPGQRHVEQARRPGTLAVQEHDPGEHDEHRSRPHGPRQEGGTASQGEQAGCGQARPIVPDDGRPPHRHGKQLRDDLRQIRLFRERADEVHPRQEQHGDGDRRECGPRHVPRQEPQRNQVDESGLEGDRSRHHRVERRAAHRFETTRRPGRRAGDCRACNRPSRRGIRRVAGRARGSSDAGCTRSTRDGARGRGRCRSGESQDARATAATRTCRRRTRRNRPCEASSRAA